MKIKINSDITLDYLPYTIIDHKNEANTANMFNNFLQPLSLNHYLLMMIVKNLFLNRLNSEKEKALFSSRIILRKSQVHQIQLEFRLDYSN